MVPDPKKGDENGLSTQGATRCAPRMPNWKMGPTLQGLLSGDVGCGVTQWGCFFVLFASRASRGRDLVPFFYGWGGGGGYSLCTLLFLFCSVIVHKSVRMGPFFWNNDLACRSQDANPPRCTSKHTTFLLYQRISTTRSPSIPQCLVHPAAASHVVN